MNLFLSDISKLRLINHYNNCLSKAAKIFGSVNFLFHILLNKLQHFLRYFHTQLSPLPDCFGCYLNGIQSIRIIEILVAKSELLHTCATRKEIKIPFLPCIAINNIHIHTIHVHRPYIEDISLCITLPSFHKIQMCRGDRN